MAAVTGMVSPEPVPIAASGAIREAKLACWPSRAMAARPAATRPIPPATVRPVPALPDTSGATVAAAAISKAIGTNASPALLGEKPRMPCRYRGVKKYTPRTPNPHSTSVAVPPLNTRPRNSARSTMGAPERDSAAAKAPAAAAVTANAARMAGEVQPTAWPWISA